MAVPVRAMKCIEQVVVSGGIDWPRFEMQRLVLATRLGGTRPRKVAEVPHSPGDGPSSQRPPPAKHQTHVRPLVVSRVHLSVSGLDRLISYS